MSRQRVARNAAFSVAQVLLSATALILTYRILLQSLRIEEIGLWSLIVGSAAVARLSEMGLGAGVLRFVAGDYGRGRLDLAARTVGMACIGAAALVGVLALIVQPLLLHYLLLGTPGPLHVAARALLPAALGSVVLTTIAGVFLNAIDGCQRMDIRARLQVGSSLVQLGMTALLLPRLGLAGLGWVQLAQAGMLLIGSAICLMMLMRQPLGAYFGFERQRLKALFLYGGGLQISGIAQLLFEPLIKVFLTGYSGLALTGYYDMANRIVLQFRSVIVAAYMAVVPHVAARGSELSVDQSRAIYRESCGLLLYVLLPYFACIAAGMPLALILWKGQFDALFLDVAILQLGAWWLNCLALPAYLLNVGLGRLRWNILSHVAVGIITVTLGLLLGKLLGGWGVLASGAIALAIGSLVVPIAFHREFKQPLLELLSWRNLPPLVLLVTAMAAATAIAELGSFPGWTILIALPAGVGLAGLALMWSDPLRKQLLAQLVLKRAVRDPQ
jgi:O-antigen/teichoic acid export membrane protein